MFELFIDFLNNLASNALVLVLVYACHRCVLIVQRRGLALQHIWTSLLSWPRWRKTGTEAFLPVMGTGAIVLSVVTCATGIAPPWVEAWAILSAALIAVVGFWVIARLIWQMGKQGTGMILNHPA